MKNNTNKKPCPGCEQGLFDIFIGLSSFFFNLSFFTFSIT